MAYNRTQVRSLLSSSELELFGDSLADAIGERTPAQLRAAVKRSRNLRDKYRDLLQRQRVATRKRTGSKSGPSGDANQRSAQKAQVFDEVLQRYQTRLDRVEAAAERESQRSARRAGGATTQLKRALDAKKKRPPATPRTAPAGAAKTARTDKTGAGSGARAARKSSKLQEAGVTRVQGHVGVQNRRQQAKRDSGR